MEDSLKNGSAGTPDLLEPSPGPQIKRIDNIKAEEVSGRQNSVGKISVDFETAIDKTGYGKFNYCLLLLAFPSACSSGFDTGAVSLVIPYASCELELSSVYEGCLNAAPYAGMVISAFLWGFLSDALGRQKLLAFGYLVDACMSILAGLAPSFWFLFMFKFVSGFMVCGPYSIFMAYMSELFNNKTRDMAVLSAGIFGALGSIIQPAIAMYLVSLDFKVQLFGYISLTPWRVFLMTSCFPSLISGLFSLCCVESPKFLMDQGKKEEALNVFQTIYTINTGKPRETYPVTRLHDARSSSVIARTQDLQGNKSVLKTLRQGLKEATKLFKPPFLSKAVFVFLIQLGSLSSLNGLRLTLPMIFNAMTSEAAMSDSTTSDDEKLCEIVSNSFNRAPSDPLERDCSKIEMKPEVFTNMMWIYAVCLVSHAFLLVLIRHVSKKSIIVGAMLSSSLVAIFIPMVPTFLIIPLASAYLALLNANFYTLIGTVVEMFPTSMRATAVGLSMMFGRCGVLIANIGLTALLHKSCSSVFYILFGALVCSTSIGVFLPTASTGQQTKIEKKDPDKS